MVLVPGGTTTIGSDHHYPEERPVREVTVGDVWFDEHPVTNAEFARFVQETGHVTVAETAPDPADFPGADPALLVAGSQVFTQTTGACTSATGRSGGAGSPARPGARRRARAATGRSSRDHPVVHVGWADAAAYARWADKQLPTEAEWEYAARGGLVGRDFAWGDELSPGGAVLANTWRGAFPWRSDDPDGHHRTSPVGSYPANGHGLHDMIGNVWEWTRTRWTASHTGDAARTSPPAAAARCAWRRPTGWSPRAARTCARPTTASATGRRPGRATASTTAPLTWGSGACAAGDGARAGHLRRTPRPRAGPRRAPRPADGPGC